LNVRQTHGPPLPHGLIAGALSPRDSAASTWQHFSCELHAHLAQWDAAIESCNKAFAGNQDNWRALANLAAANACAGHDKEAAEAVAELRKLHPDFTVQTWAGIHSEE
jgi:adenylate cyclase